MIDRITELRDVKKVARSPFADYTDYGDEWVDKP